MLVVRFLNKSLLLQPSRACSSANCTEAAPCALEPCLGVPAVRANSCLVLPLQSTGALLLGPHSEPLQGFHLAREKPNTCLGGEFLVVFLF